MAADSPESTLAVVVLSLVFVLLWAVMTKDRND